MKCSVCGCTDERACEGGCSWASDDPPTCSRCVGKPVPVFNESLGGALIDSARISVLAAMAMLPAPVIITPPEAVLDADEAAASACGCLEQAMQWLDAARALSISPGTPVTSLHVVAR